MVRFRLVLVSCAALATSVFAADPQPQPADALRKAASLFNQASTQPALFGDAAKMFAAAFLGKVQMSPDQMAAWAYCRVRVAADRLNRGPADSNIAAEVAQDVEEALALAPSNAGLQKVGRELIASARQRAGKSPMGTLSVSSDGWNVIESPSFRIRFQGSRAAAEAVSVAAEARRSEIFARWSGPPGGGWEPKCEVVLHPTAAAFAAATHQPAGGTGHAVVRLNGGKPVERRIDLRADDATTAEDALPRELTLVVLADLFPGQAPPKWAEAGMAVLAASDSEQDRYRRTLDRCYRDGELMPIASLLELTAPPADRVTGYLVESVSVVEFLVRSKGAKQFTTFLRDAQRYGVPAAMKRQYGFTDAGQLQVAWMRSALTVARGQGE